MLLIVLREGKTNKHFDGLSPKGGGFPQKSNVSVLFFHVFPSFHDICQNWYSKKTHSPH